IIIKSYLLTIVFLLTSFSLNSQGYANPFWKDKTHKIVIINKNFHIDKLIFNHSINYINSNALEQRIYFDNETALYISNYLIFNNKFRWGYDGLKILDFGLIFYPVSFFKIHLNYNGRLFNKYKTIEHNIILDTEIFYNEFKYIFIGTNAGFDFKFADLSIDNYNKVYNQNIVFNLVFFYKLYILFNPIFLYSIGFSLGNKNNFKIYSFNDIQIEFVNYFHLPKNISIFIKAGFGFAGGMPFAGYIDRFWIDSGLRYEINFNY
ncbi:MAG TPA: hypothetical protein PK771_15825, partial [Spirochaetota bacterium]|nr:hypothetical protein [Spirochaetota bacterium]